MNLSENLRPEMDGGGFAANFDAAVDLAGPGSGGLAAADTDAVPLVRVQPEYPMRAAQRGVEGWVEVEITISKTGAVKNPSIIAYQPSKIFNKAVMRAVQKWKYNPKIVNGSAVERHGVIVRVDFKL
jgi:protein TonB